MLKQAMMAGAIALTAVVMGCGEGDDAAPAGTVEGAAAGEAGAPAGTTAGGQAAGGLADGTYVCTYNSGGMLYTLGKLQIKGNQYSGFSGDKWGTYSGTKETSFTFHDGLVGIPEGFTVTASSWLTSSYSGDRYLEIAYVSPSGNSLSTTCSKE